jgi:hypothetical protein
MKGHLFVIEESQCATSTLQVPVPSDWYGKPWGELMTFDEAQKALNSDETRQAVALMKEIDLQLGIEAELSSGINESPNGANVVIVHDIKTPVDADTLRYLAAVKGKALLDESPDLQKATKKRST